ncbi:hypothetical protein M4951_16965 [Blastopirellula sp. J2-11]|uniref:hypothetical protein n=1 Tax=Blastopirellula sp. J2-11 TaxID=2943192 RepID=UPI0021C69C73|nr:hypothetical protein [Blastopirellula sp. J2-11]UUO05069.1 hypothetical protein M4951_16965 [Blastopirellula sp. J2-11]
MNRNHIVLLVPGMLLLCFTGCWKGDIGTVEGTLQVDGKPMGGFYVYFIPADGTAEAMGGVIGDGSYKLTYGRGDDRIPVGEYRVYVQATEFIDNVSMPKVKLERQYTDPYETSLVKTIDYGHNVIDLDLTSAKKK